MPYSLEQIEHNIIDLDLTRKFLLRNYKNSNGARAANKNRFPNGYIYIVKLKGYDLYKIGVSNKPKRRIQDIDSYSPFGIHVVGVYYFTNVYEMEEMIHENLNVYLKRKEWFKIDEITMIEFKEDIIEFCKNKTHLIKKDECA